MATYDYFSAALQGMDIVDRMYAREAQEKAQRQQMELERRRLGAYEDQIGLQRTQADRTWQQYQDEQEAAEAEAEARRRLAQQLGQPAQAPAASKGAPAERPPSSGEAPAEQPPRLGASPQTSGPRIEDPGLITSTAIQNPGRMQEIQEATAGGRTVTQPSAGEQFSSGMQKMLRPEDPWDLGARAEGAGELLGLQGRAYREAYERGVPEGVQDALGSVGGYLNDAVSALVPEETRAQIQQRREELGQSETPRARDTGQMPAGNAGVAPNPDIRLAAPAGGGTSAAAGSAPREDQIPANVDPTPARSHRSAVERSSPEQTQGMLRTIGNNIRGAAQGQAWSPEGAEALQNAYAAGILDIQEFNDLYYGKASIEQQQSLADLMQTRVENEETLAELSGTPKQTDEAMKDRVDGWEERVNTMTDWLDPDDPTDQRTKEGMNTMMYQAAEMGLNPNNPKHLEHFRRFANSVQRAYQNSGILSSDDEILNRYEQFDRSIPAFTMYPDADDPMGKFEAEVLPTLREGFKDIPLSGEARSKARQRSVDLANSLAVNHGMDPRQAALTASEFLRAAPEQTAQLGRRQVADVAANLYNQTQQGN